MTSPLKLTTAILVALLAAAPVAADPGHGHGKGRHAERHDGHGPGHPHRVQARHVADCPPGLARKTPRCVPPGQARKHYGKRIGDTLRIGDYTRIRDLDRYDLRARRGWDYYRDEDRIYRVDGTTRKILAVLDLIEAFSH